MDEIILGQAQYRESVCAAVLGTRRHNLIVCPALVRCGDVPGTLKKKEKETQRKSTRTRVGAGQGSLFSFSYM